MDLQLGVLEQIDTRQIWPHESMDFTPWLAANLSMLEDVLDMELQIENEEVSIGMFRADIVARDLKTNTPVLIENQLDKTDHCHLGQIITYAAGLRASTIVWIAKHFCDEHLAALDWLNEISNDIQFFGVQVEAWKINESIAPKFNVVRKSNNWVKVAKKASRVGITPIDIMEKRERLKNCIVNAVKLGKKVNYRKVAADARVSYGTVNKYKEDIIKEISQELPAIAKENV